MPLPGSSALVATLVSLSSSLVLFACAEDGPDREQLCGTPQSYGSLGVVLAQLKPSPIPAYQTIEIKLGAGSSKDWLITSVPQNVGTYPMDAGGYSPRLDLQDGTSYRALSGELMLTEVSFPTSHTPIAGSMSNVVLRGERDSGVCYTEIEWLSFRID